MVFDYRIMSSLYVVFGGCDQIRPTAVPFYNIENIVENIVENTLTIDLVGSWLARSTNRSIIANIEYEIVSQLFILVSV